MSVWLGGSSATGSAKHAAPKVLISYLHLVQEMWKVHNFYASTQLSMP